MSRGASARLGRALAAAFAAACAGCASIPPPTAIGPHWQGRLAVRVAEQGTRPAESFSTAFELNGSGEAGELILTTPIGTRAALARWSAQGAELHDGQGVRRYASLEALSSELLKQDIPLAALPDWLAGKPWPGAPALATQDGFTQLGWAVDTSRRAEGALRAAREAPPAIALTVRLEP